MMRCLCLDVGDRRVGVAVSDPLGITAQPFETYIRSTPASDVAHFMSIVKSLCVSVIVCGLPLNMDGSRGHQSALSVEFAEGVAAVCGIGVEYVDERLTTALSRRELIEAGMRRDKRKEVIDQLAAVHILQTYLDRTRAK